MVTGLLESSLTWERMWQAHVNYVPSFPASTLPPKVATFMTQQWEWMWSNIHAAPSDAYWQHVGVLLSTVQGLADGYNRSADAPRSLSFLQVGTPLSSRWH